MLDLSWCVATAEVLAQDRALLAEVDAALRRGVQRAGPHLVCRPGCTPCCIGPFDITPLDAVRLRSGLRALRSIDAARAERLQGRARDAWRRLEGDFPGSAGDARLDDDDEARERFFRRHAGEPCPALDSTSGWCELYAFRPLSCRTFGLPVRTAGIVLGPCSLGFRTAQPAEIVDATVEPDPDDREGSLLASLAATGVKGDTVVAAVLAAAEEGARWEPCPRPQP